MTRPELKQYGSLTPADFQQHAVWVACHTVDDDEEGYEDGSRLPGFVTPAEEADDLGVMQPQMFVEGARHAFWGGMTGIPQEDRQQLYRALGKAAEATFPARFEAESGLATGACSGRVAGFYSSSASGAVECER